MRHLPTVLAAVALAVSAHTRRHTRKTIQRHTTPHAPGPNPFTERLRAKQRAEGEDRISVNGQDDKRGWQ